MPPGAYEKVLDRRLLPNSSGARWPKHRQTGAWHRLPSPHKLLRCICAWSAPSTGRPPFPQRWCSSSRINACNRLRHSAFVLLSVSTPSNTLVGRPPWDPGNGLGWVKCLYAASPTTSIYRLLSVFLPLNPPAPQVWCELAVALAESGQAAEAMVAADAARALAPWAPASLCALGAVYDTVGRYEPAVQVGGETAWLWVYGGWGRRWGPWVPCLFSWVCACCVRSAVV